MQLHTRTLPGPGSRPGAGAGGRAVGGRAATAERREGARMAGPTRAGDWRCGGVGASAAADRMGRKRAGDGRRASAPGATRCASSPSRACSGDTCRRRGTSHGDAAAAVVAAEAAAAARRGRGAF